MPNNKKKKGKKKKNQQKPADAVEVPEAVAPEAVKAAEVAAEVAAPAAAAEPSDAKVDAVADNLAEASIDAKKDEEGGGAKERAAKAVYEAMYGLDRGDKKKKQHKFWNTQPVPQMDDKPVDHGPIEVKTLEEVRAKPYPLMKGFKWCACDMNDPATVDEVYNLLCQNYVEDDDNMFRFDYSRNFLQWALQPPGYVSQLHVGVRVEKSNKLVGFITGIPADMVVYDRDVKMVEINFLCVHKKLRSKRLAPVLIKEVTRRVNCTKVWQAVYTAGVVLPKPVAQNRYYHRSLNPKKLIDIGFSRLQKNMTIPRTIKLYKVEKQTQIPGIRPLEEKDIPAAAEMLRTYLKKFELHQVFSDDEFRHWFMPREGVVNSFVVEDPETKQLTDLTSFYTLPSTIIGNDKYKTLKTAYSFYNVANKTKWEDLMMDSLIIAKQLNFDVFNALNVMENDEFLHKLKFGIGDGHLQYYLYNWRCPEMDPKQVGLVLL